MKKAAILMVLLLAMSLLPIVGTGVGAEGSLEMSYTGGYDSLKWGVINVSSPIDVESMNEIHIQNNNENRVYVNITLTVNDLYGEPNNLLMGDNYFLSVLKNGSPLEQINASDKRATIDTTLAYNEHFDITVTIREISQWVGGNLSGTFYISAFYYTILPGGVPSHAVDDEDFTSSGQFVVTLYSTGWSPTYPYSGGVYYGGDHIKEETIFSTAQYNNIITISNTGTQSIDRLWFKVGRMSRNGVMGNAYIKEYASVARWRIQLCTGPSGPCSNVASASDGGAVDLDSTNGEIEIAIVSWFGFATRYYRIVPSTVTLSADGISSYDWNEGYPESFSVTTAESTNYFGMRVRWGGIGGGYSGVSKFNAFMDFQGPGFNPDVLIADGYDFDTSVIDLTGTEDTNSPPTIDFEEASLGDTNVWSSSALIVDNGASTISVNSMDWTIPPYLHLDGNTGDTTNRIGLGDGSNLDIIWTTHALSTGIYTVSDKLAGVPLTGRSGSDASHEAQNVQTSVNWRATGSSGATFATQFSSSNYMGTTVSATGTSSRSAWAFRLDSIPSGISGGAYYNPTQLSVTLRHDWGYSFAPMLAPTLQTTVGGVEVSAFNTLADFNDASVMPLTYTIQLNNTGSSNVTVNLTLADFPYEGLLDYPTSVALEPYELLQLVLNATINTSLPVYSTFNLTFESGGDDGNVILKTRPPVEKTFTFILGKRGEAQNVYLDYIDGSSGFIFDAVETGAVSTNIALITNAGNKPIKTLRFQTNNFFDEDALPVENFTYHIRGTDNNDYYPDEDGSITIALEDGFILGIGKLFAFKLVLDDVPDDLDGDEYYTYLDPEIEDVDGFKYTLSMLYASTVVLTPPVADAGDDIVVVVNQTFLLSGSDSYDDDGDVVEWAWDIDNDGDYDLLGENTSYDYEEPGAYLITLRVTDDDDNIATDTLLVTVLGSDALFSLSDSEIHVAGTVGTEIVVAFQISTVADVLIKLSMKQDSNQLYGEVFSVKVEDLEGTILVDHENITTQEVTLFTAGSAQTNIVYISMEFDTALTADAVFTIDAVDTTQPLLNQEQDVTISYTVTSEASSDLILYLGLGVVMFSLVVIAIYSLAAKAKTNKKYKEAQANKRFMPPTNRP